MSSKFYEPPSNRNDIKEAQIEHQQQNLNSQREQRQRQRQRGMRRELVEKVMLT